jgi:hypothetical protein
MTHTAEIRKDNGQLQFSLAVLGATNLQAKTNISKKRATAVADARTYQLNLSGDRVLAAVAAAGGFIGVFIWAVIRLWLFEP